MPRSLRLLPALLVFVPVTCFALGQEPPPGGDAEPIHVAATDWPWWRGPHGNGVAAADQDPPLGWSVTENVLWHAAVPGRGHGSPIVVGDRVVLPTADNATQTQSVLCYDRQTGKRRWQTTVHRGGFNTKGNAKSSLASSTAACDGTRVFVNFLNAGAVYTTALDLNGKQLWQTKVTDYVLHQGYGSSPMPYKSVVLVSADNKGGGAVAALDRRTGKVVWKRERPATPNYASPIVVHADGRDQLVMIGCNRVASFDPLTGKTLWDIPGATTECVTSTVTDGTLIYSTGGFPRDHIAAIRADGSGKVAWELKMRIYVPSMLLKDGYLYCVPDNGIAMCLKADTGKALEGAARGRRLHRLAGAGRRPRIRHQRRRPHVHLPGDAGEVHAARRRPARRRGPRHPRDLRRPYLHARCAAQGWPAARNAVLPRPREVTCRGRDVRWWVWSEFNKLFDEFRQAIGLKLEGE